MVPLSLIVDKVIIIFYFATLYHLAIMETILGLIV